MSENLKQSDGAGWEIGWAEVDITPAQKIDLAGQYYPRVSQAIHSPLGATVFAVGKANESPALLISVDVVGVPRDFLEELRSALQERIPGLDPDRVITCATHTHSSCALGKSIARGKDEWRLPGEDSLPVLEFRKSVLEKLCAAAKQAWDSRQPGGLAPAISHAVIGHCRRAVYANGSCEMYGDVARGDFLGLEGGEDSTVQLLFACDGQKRPTGVVVNVACPSQVMEARRVISSDFMGETRRLLKEHFGQSFGVLGQISAAGCQSPRHLPLTRDDEFWSERGVRELGRRLFEAVLRGAENIGDSCRFEANFFHRRRELNLPRRRVDYSQFKAAELELGALEQKQAVGPAFQDFVAEVVANEKIPGRPGPYDSKLHHFVLIQNAKAVLRRWAEQDAQPDLPVELQVLRLGDSVLVTNPFELFLDFGQAIQARSAARHTFVVQIACGYSGYLPTEAAERHGGYGGLVINGQVGAPGGRMLVDETVAGIAEAMQG